MYKKQNLSLTLLPPFLTSISLALIFLDFEQLCGKTYIKWENVIYSASNKKLQ